MDALRIASFQSTCTDIGPNCPVEGSIYQYAPSIGLNAFLIAAFTLVSATHAFLGVWKKTYFFGCLLTLSSLAESVGYAGRVLLGKNPYQTIGLNLDLVCLMSAPSLICMAIHLTLAYIMVTFGATISFLSPQTYTWIFMLCDLVCLALQAAGGVLVANAGQTGVVVEGAVLMIAGLVFQTLSLVVFGALVADYLVRTWKAWHEVPFAASKLLDTLNFKLFIAGIFIAFVTVLARCVYRIMQIIGGWPNDLLHKETAFEVLESFMILTACLALATFHPGFCSPKLGTEAEKKQRSIFSWSNGPLHADEPPLDELDIMCAGIGSTDGFGVLCTEVENCADDYQKMLEKKADRSSQSTGYDSTLTWSSAEPDSGRTGSMRSQPEATWLADPSLADAASTISFPPPIAVEREALRASDVWRH